MSYGIREMQESHKVPSTRVLTTVDTCATRWGNQFRQIERNNVLKPVLDFVVDKWKREHKNRLDAIVEDDDDNPQSKVRLPAPT